MRIGEYIYCGILTFLILTLGHTDETKLPPHQLHTILDNTAAYCWIDTGDSSVLKLETGEVKENLELKMNLQKNKKQFFVIIEHISLWCLYNEVK